MICKLHLSINYCKFYTSKLLQNIFWNKILTHISLLTKAVVLTVGILLLDISNLLNLKR